MELILKLTTKIIILLIVGIIACRYGLLNKEAREYLSGLLINIILPASMLSSSQQEFNTSYLSDIGQIALIAIAYYVVVFILAFLFLRIPKFKKKFVAISTLLIGFANTAFLGIPLLTEITGPTGTLFAVIFNCFFNIFYFTLGMYMIENASHDKVVEFSDENYKDAEDIYSGSLIKKIVNFDWKQLLGSPVAIVSILTIILYVLPFRFPVVLGETLNALGSTMMPISMLIIGSQIYEMDIKKLFNDWKVYVMSFVRMLLIPVVMLVIMLLIHASFEVATTIVVLSAMPSGSLNVIMAEKYDSYPDFATATVMQTTLLMIITLPVFTYLCELLFHG